MVTEVGKISKLVSAAPNQKKCWTLKLKKSTCCHYFDRYDICNVSFCGNCHFCIPLPLKIISKWWFCAKYECSPSTWRTDASLMCPYTSHPGSEWSCFMCSLTEEREKRKNPNIWIKNTRLENVCVSIKNNEKRRHIFKHLAFISSLNSQINNLVICLSVVAQALTFPLRNVPLMVSWVPK